MCCAGWSSRTAPRPITCAPTCTACTRPEPARIEGTDTPPAIVRRRPFDVGPRLINVAVPMKISTILIAIMATALTAQAKLVTKTVPYEHEGVKLEGYLTYDDSRSGPQPGVLV